MRADELKEIIERLDEGVPRENARVSLQKYDDTSEQAFIVATENGYLRLGVEFLKAGVAPHLPPERTEGRRPQAIDVELDYLLTEDSDLRFDFFERSEDIKIETQEDSWVDRAIVLGILGVILAIFVLAVVGLVSIVRALF
jgi:hypothetical protein